MHSLLNVKAVMCFSLGLVVYGGELDDEGHGAGLDRVGVERSEQAPALG